MYCSDLVRCTETLQIATSAASELHDSAAAALLPAPQYLPLLRERGAGVFEGTPLGTVDAAAAAAGMTIKAFRPEGGESWGDVRARAVKFLSLYVRCVCLFVSLRLRPQPHVLVAATYSGWLLTSHAREKRARPCLP